MEEKSKVIFGNPMPDKGIPESGKVEKEICKNSGTMQGQIILQS